MTAAPRSDVEQQVARRAGETRHESVRQDERATVGPEPDRPARTPLTAARVLELLAPALIYLGIRQLGVLVLAWMGSFHSTTVTGALRSWDGDWFLAIAESGYAGVRPELVDAFGGRDATTPMAFFPGYPGAVGLVGDATGLDLVTAGLLVTIVAGVATAYGLTMLGELIRGGSRRAGLILVALFAATPMSVVLSMTYSEALFCAGAVWALVAVLRRWWLVAGLACAFAGLVRPTAAALVLAVGLAALVAVLSRRDGWRPWVAGLLAPVGLLGYLAWVGVRAGRWDGWFHVQRKGWESGFDGGDATLRFAGEALAQARSVLEVTTVAVIVVALVLAVLCVVRRVEWPLVVYGIAVLAMDLGSNGLMNSKIRLMVPAFTLLIPVALALAKRRTPTVVLALCALAVASSWYGAYTLTAWEWAI